MKPSQGHPSAVTADTRLPSLLLESWAATKEPSLVPPRHPESRLELSEPVGSSQLRSLEITPWRGLPDRSPGDGDVDSAHTLSVGAAKERGYETNL